MFRFCKAHFQLVVSFQGFPEMFKETHWFRVIVNIDFKPIRQQETGSWGEEVFPNLYLEWAGMISAGISSV